MSLATAHESAVIEDRGWFCGADQEASERCLRCEGRRERASRSEPTKRLAS